MRNDGTNVVVEDPVAFVQAGGVRGKDVKGGACHHPNFVEKSLGNQS
jgi:hypothetical protein